MLCAGKKDLFASTLDKTGCNRMMLAAGAWSGLLTLNYHRIGEPGATLFDRELWSATLENFEQQVIFLKTHFDLIGPDDLYDVLQSDRGRFAMITFDDGYRDNYELAFPTLQDLNVPATFFLSTGFLDHPRVPWWDEISWIIRSSSCPFIHIEGWVDNPIQITAATENDSPDTPSPIDAAVHQLLRLYKSLSIEQTEPFLNQLGETCGTGRAPESVADELWMTWDMVREMRDAGMFFGGHTVQHPILASLPPEGQDREIGECARRLEEELGERCATFSYPVGRPETFDEVTRACLIEHGFQWSFSYYGGYQKSGPADNLNLPRTPVEIDMDLSRIHSIAALPQLFA